MTHMRRRLPACSDAFAVFVAALALGWLTTTAAAARHSLRLQRTNGQGLSTPAAAVCLYGPNAGMLAVTRASVWARLLDVLAYQGWRADVYVHAYDPWSEAVPRAEACAGNESMLAEVGDVSMASTAPWRLLQPVQEKVVGKEWLASTADDNDARLAASLAAVTRMWQGNQAASGGGQYQAIIYARHDLWYFADLDMASLSCVAKEPDTIVTHDACTARRQALPDFMLVNPRAAENLVQVAGQARRNQAKRRGQCSVAGPAAEVGLKVRRVEVGATTYVHIGRSGLLAPQRRTTETKQLGHNALVQLFNNSAGTSSSSIGAELSHICVNGIGAWDAEDRLSKLEAQ